MKRGEIILAISGQPFSLKEVSELIWEEHHLDFSNSLITPIYQYQAVFKINKKIQNIQRICLPDGWFIEGGDIIEFKINYRVHIPHSSQQKYLGYLLLEYPSAPPLN